MTPERVEQILSALFDRAKDADEFEYACTLLRFQGMEDAGWDPLVETQFLFDEIGSLLEAPLRDETRVRLGLLLYSHLTEVDAIYMTIANLLAVTRGERYSLDPFGDLYRPRGIPRYEQLPPSANSVVKRLCDDATAAGFDDVRELLEWFFNSAVRNAFFHSDYILHAGEFRSREGRFADGHGGWLRSLPVDQIIELIDGAMIFFQTFMSLFGAHRRSYTVDREIQGRFAADGSMIPVILSADAERGLYGFRSP